MASPTVEKHVLKINRKPFDDCYELIHPKIGAGHFSRVYAAVDRETGGQFAVKIIQKDWFLEDAKRVQMLEREIGILSKVSYQAHPNVVQLFELFETEDELLLVMEFMGGGELFDDIMERGHYSEHDASVIMRQIFSATEFLHSHNVAHRDLKPENLLLDDTGHVKIADFGLSTILPEDTVAHTACGTPTYVAPEVIAYEGGVGYTHKCDMWSLGVCMYILMCGFAPFAADDQATLLDVIRQGAFDFPAPYWAPVSEPAKDLIRKLLTVDPEIRISASEALSHPWFEEQLPSHHEDFRMENMKTFNAHRRLKGVMHAHIGSIRMMLQHHRNQVESRKVSPPAPITPPRPMHSTQPATVSQGNSGSKLTSALGPGEPLSSSSSHSMHSAHSVASVTSEVAAVSIN